MVRNSSELLGRKIIATDGPIGSVTDLLIDTGDWYIRWAVIDTGAWLPGRKVLLPPSQLHDHADDPSAFGVQLTQEQVRNSPEEATDRPVTRLLEERLLAYYQAQPYWLTAAPMEMIAPPMLDPALMPSLDETAEKKNSQLRSVVDLARYSISAADGQIGRLQHAIIAPDSWMVLAMEAMTGGWLTGRRVLIATTSVSAIDDDAQIVHVALTRDQIANSPQYEATASLGLDFVGLTYGYYGVPMPLSLGLRSDDKLR